MKVLHLTLKKKWFDMVGNGKPEEYRELTDFWKVRLMHYELRERNNNTPLKVFTEFKEWDLVSFANGGHFGNVPKKTFKFKGIEIREGNPEWGAEPGKKYFVIKLGNQIHFAKELT